MLLNEQKHEFMPAERSELTDSTKPLLRDDPK